MKDSEEKELKTMISAAERRSKRSSIITVVSILAGVAVFFTIAITQLSLPTKAEPKDTLATTDTVTVVQNENLITIEKAIAINEDSIVRVYEKKTDYSRLINQYYYHVVKKNADSLSMMYADSVKQYYRKQNLSQAEVFNYIEKGLESYPDQIIKDLKIDFENDLKNNWVVLRYARNGKNFEKVWVNIKFDENDKIYFIRSYNRDQRKVVYE